MPGTVHTTVKTPSKVTAQHSLAVGQKGNANVNTFFPHKQKKNEVGQKLSQQLFALFALPVLKEHRNYAREDFLTVPVL